VGLELVEDREDTGPADVLGGGGNRRMPAAGPVDFIVRSGEQANCFRIAPPQSVTRDEIDLAMEIHDEARRSGLASRERSRASAGSSLTQASRAC
jgi:hypothetical protein